MLLYSATYESKLSLILWVGCVNDRFHKTIVAKSISLSDMTDTLLAL